MDGHYSGIKNYLARAVQQGKTAPSAYLVVGSTSADRAFVCQHFCDNLSPSAIITLDSADDGAGSISVLDVRNVLSQISRTSFDGGMRVVLCKNAERLTQEAGNALLKSLEEPVEQTFFMFSAQHQDALLGTIRSRCAIIRLPVRRHMPVADTVKGYTQWKGMLSLPLWRRMSEELHNDVIEEYIHQLFHDECANANEKRAVLSVSEQLSIIYRSRSLASARSAHDRLTLAFP